MGEIDISFFLLNSNAEGGPAELPPKDDHAVYLYTGMVREEQSTSGDVLKQLNERGNTVLGIHDSFCQGCSRRGRGGCPAEFGSALGCPNLGVDFLTMDNRVYFTPWGSDMDRLAEQTAAWGKTFHGPNYVGLNMLCSVSADEAEDRQKWSNLMFRDSKYSPAEYKMRGLAP